MTAASSVAKTLPGLPRLGAAMASRPLMAALLVTALITAMRLNGTVDSDVAWQLWVAGRVHAGAQLYRDIIEVNPPLWFWMALPVDSAATYLHLRPESVLTVAIGAIAALALAATDRLLGNISTLRRSLLLSYAALILMAMPWAHLGQREQIVLICTVPYAALVAARSDSKPISPLLAILIGAGAAIGFALKHYFLIVPVFLELWLLLRQRRGWRLVRPETIAIAVAGALYGAAILVWARDFLTTIVPLVRLAYGMLGPPSIKYLFGPFAVTGLVTTALVAIHARRSVNRAIPFTSALLIAAAGFATIYFIQSKGWIYHAIPLLGCSSLTLAALMAESTTPMRLLRLAAPAFLSLPLFLAAQETKHPGLPTPDLESAISGLRPGDTVGYLAVETAVPWSITLQHGLRYPSRYMGYWMLNAVVQNEHRADPDPRLTALGRQIVTNTVADFTCAPPARIIVSRPPPGESGFDILPLFVRDPRFAELLSHYKVRSRTSFETYELASPLPLPSAPCRPGI